MRYLINSNTSVTADFLQKEFNITNKCVQNLLHKIRIAMGNVKYEKIDDGIYEMDESYFGGRTKKKKIIINGKIVYIPSKTGLGTKQIIVLGIFERNRKLIFIKVIKKYGKKYSVTGKILKAFADTICGKRVTIYSDGHKAYNIFDKYPEKYYKHEFVNHSNEEYVRGDVYTNNIEGFWRIAKKSTKISFRVNNVNYLKGYIDEHCFRFNNRGNSNLFDTLLKQTVIKKEKLISCPVNERKIV
jgi:hypothetical protein